MTNAELERRIAELEAKALTLADLPLAALKRHLESNWQPDGTTAMLPGSVGASALANIPACRCYTSTNQGNPFALGAWPIYYDVAEPTINQTYDKVNMHTPSAVTPGENMIAPVGGLYLCTATAFFTDTAAARWASLLLYHQPSVTLFEGASAAWGAGDIKILHVAGAFYFAAGEYLQVNFQTSNVACTVDSSSVSMTYIGAYR